MIPLVPTHETVAAPSSGWTFAAFIQEMFRSWVSHHERLAEAGIAADL